MGFHRRSPTNHPLLSVSWSSTEGGVNIIATIRKEQLQIRKNGASSRSYANGGTPFEGIQTRHLENHPGGCNQKENLHGRREREKYRRTRSKQNQMGRRKWKAELNITLNASNWYYAVISPPPLSFTYAFPILAFPFLQWWFCALISPENKTPGRRLVLCRVSEVCTFASIDVMRLPPFPQVKTQVRIAVIFKYRVVIIVLPIRCNRDFPCQ